MEADAEDPSATLGTGPAAELEAGPAAGHTITLVPDARDRSRARIIAVVQVILICGIPTQLVLTVLLMASGVRLFVGGEISLELIATLSFADTALVAMLIKLFLHASGETSRDVFLGSRPAGREIGIGLALVPVTIAGVGAIVLAARQVVPWLHNVKTNPLEPYMKDPLDAAIFIVVVVLAGGVREELQRAFILHRFRQHLGGAWVGLVVFGLLFGALHYNQGWDVAIGIGVLGLCWGLGYLRRGSVLAPMANHAGFNAAQVAAVFLKM